MLKINNVSVVSEDQPILKNIKLSVAPSEIHAIIGPRLSGKSALAHLISGHPGIIISEGSVSFNGENLCDLEPDQISKKGIYVSFQTPLEFNFTVWDLMKQIFARDEENVLKESLDKFTDLLDLDYDYKKTKMNSNDMSVSEAKRTDLMYMLMTSPDLIVLDEIDADLDDADERNIIIVSSIIKEYLRSSKGKSCIVITSSKTMLDILEPDKVHVMVGGEIKTSGDKDLYKRIVSDGYSEFS